MKKREVDSHRAQNKEVHSDESESFSKADLQQV